MKKFLLVPACLALANCAAIPALLTQAVSVGQTVQVPATQALIVAHNAYQAAAEAATTTINTCVAVNFAGPCSSLKARLPQVKALSDKAVELLNEADAGRDVAANAAEVMNIVSSLHSLSGVN